MSFLQLQTAPAMNEDQDDEEFDDDNNDSYIPLSRKIVPILFNHLEDSHT